MPPPYQGEHESFLDSILKSGDSKITCIGREVIGRCKDGSIFPMELTVSQMAVAGKPMFTGLVRDITERKQAEADLHDREERVQAILDTIFDGVLTIDERGTIRTFNVAAERHFGYSALEIVGQSVNRLMPEPYRSEHDGYMGDYLRTGDAKIIGAGREVIGLRKDGSTFPMELAVSWMVVGSERMFTGIVRDITERKQAETMKREFVSTVSHELRTPLTSIKGSLGLIRTGAIGKLPHKLSSMLEIAYNNSDRLVRLINDILDVEKIEAGKMDFQMVPMELGALLEQAIDANRGYAEEYGVHFVLMGEPRNATVNGDHESYRKEHDRPRKKPGFTRCRRGRRNTGTHGYT